MLTVGRSLQRQETTFNKSFRTCSKVTQELFRDIRERSIGKIKCVLRLKLAGDLFVSGQGFAVDGQGQATAAAGDATHRRSNHVVALIIQPSSFSKNG